MSQKFKRLILMRRIASGAVVLAVDAQAARRGDQLLPVAAVVGGKLHQRMPGNGAVEQRQFAQAHKRRSRLLRFLRTSGHGR